MIPIATIYESEASAVICVYIDNNDLRSLECATLTLANMLKLHSDLSQEYAELLETHIERLRKMTNTAKEADDI